MSEAERFLDGSQVYDPVAVLRREDETLVVARVGGRTSRRFMILTPAGDPAWRHEPFGSLSDVGWSLRAHAWHDVAPEQAGQDPRSAKTLSRLLQEQV